MYIEVPNPDDPFTPPIYEGQHEQAAEVLTAGAYRALDAEDDERHETILLVEHGGAFLLAPTTAALIASLWTGYTPQPGEKRGVYLTREQVNEWAGFSLTDAQVEDLADALPNSSFPETVGIIAGNWTPEDGAL